MLASRSVHVIGKTNTDHVFSLVEVPADQRLWRSGQLPLADLGRSRLRTSLRTPVAPWPMQSAFQIAVHTAITSECTEFISAPAILACDVQRGRLGTVRAAMKPPSGGDEMHYICPGLVVAKLAHPGPDRRVGTSRRDAGFERHGSIGVRPSWSRRRHRCRPYCCPQFAPWSHEHWPGRRSPESYGPTR
jgi:hypothetical protein